MAIEKFQDLDGDFAAIVDAGREIGRRANCPLGHGRSVCGDAGHLRHACRAEKMIVALSRRPCPCAPSELRTRRTSRSSTCKNAAMSRPRGGRKRSRAESSGSIFATAPSSGRQLHSMAGEADPAALETISCRPAPAPGARRQNAGAGSLRFNLQPKPLRANARRARDCAAWNASKRRQQIHARARHQPSGAYAKHPCRASLIGAPRRAALRLDRRLSARSRANAVRSTNVGRRRQARPRARCPDRRSPALELRRAVPAGGACAAARADRETSAADACAVPKYRAA